MQEHLTTPPEKGPGEIVEEVRKITGKGLLLIVAGLLIIAAGLSYVVFF
jgi:hypothetical protein